MSHSNKYKSISSNLSILPLQFYFSPMLALIKKSIAVSNQLRLISRLSHGFATKNATTTNNDDDDAKMREWMKAMIKAGKTKEMT